MDELIDRSIPDLVITKGHRKIVILRRKDGFYEIEDGKDNWITENAMYVRRLFRDML